MTTTSHARASFTLLALLLPTAGCPGSMPSAPSAGHAPRRDAKRPATGSVVTPTAVHLEHVQLALTGDHSCALLRDGGVRCWGGVQGLDAGGDRSRPSAVPNLDDAVSLSLAGDLACAVRSSGQLVCWALSLGRGSSLVSPESLAPAQVTDARAVSLGDAHACVLLRSGAVSCWVLSGRLDLAPVRAVGGIAAARAIAAGGAHTCAIVADSTVACWGANDKGQLGDGTRVSRPTAAPVPGLRGVVQLALGNDFSCARLADGAVRCWGNPLMARRDGDPSPADSPVEPAGVRDTIWIAAEGDALCWVTSSGGGRCVTAVWERPRPGTVRYYGAPLEELRDPYAADTLIAFVGARSAAIGPLHACLLTPEDDVRCWGNNEHGAVGDPWATRRFAPVPVMSADGAPASEDLQRATPQPPRMVASNAAETRYDFDSIDLSAQQLPRAFRHSPSSVPSLVRGAFVRDAAPIRACHAATATGTIVLRALLDGEGGVVADRRGRPAVAMLSATLPASEVSCVLAAVARVRWPFTRWPATVELTLGFGASP